ncbi:uncharacterized mitochondrial protein AtMg00810-like [Hibiscus syriacus]|uniref:uncharacterized mitochondrial protein AtMg00810-like n=1 Tax=Hibiscus syriacus TaxID=106335 RepID=UPI001920AB91|nr:uncharacterized mitochondrial protein AtMg00810-like [Hibiscus syriacus]
MLIYVDDLLITRNDSGLIEELKGILNKNFKMKDLATKEITLGCNFEGDQVYQKQSRSGVLLSAESQCQLQAFCDSDWATCPMTRRSIIGFCVKLGDSLLSWKSKKQNTIARSYAEAAYRSMAMTAADIVWLTVGAKWGMQP